MENIYDGEVLFTGRTSIECLTGNIVDAMTELCRTKKELNDPYFTGTIEIINNPPQLVDEKWNKNILMSVSLPQFHSFANRYLDRVNGWLRKFAGYDGYQDMIRRIASDSGIPPEFWTINAKTMRDAFSHNIRLENGYFVCDGKKVPVETWLAFSDVLSTVGDMTMFIIRVKAYMKMERQVR